MPEIQILQSFKNPNHKYSMIKNMRTANAITLVDGYKHECHIQLI